MKQFLKAAAKQNIWLAACTHSGEDEIVLKAHKKNRWYFADCAASY